MGLNPDPNIPAVFGELNNSVQNLTARLEQMLKRDPSREFDYGTDRTGANSGLIVAPRYSTERITLPFTGATFGATMTANGPVFAPFVAQSVEVEWHGKTPATNIIAYSLKMDCAQEQNFQKFTSLMIPLRFSSGFLYNLNYAPVSFVPATGQYSGIATGVFEIHFGFYGRFPISARFFRFSLVDSAGAVVTTALNGLLSGASAINVNFLGQ